METFFPMKMPWGQKRREFLGSWLRGGCNLRAKKMGVIYNLCARVYLVPFVVAFFLGVLWSSLGSSPKSRRADTGTSRPANAWTSSRILPTLVWSTGALTLEAWKRRATSCWSGSPSCAGLQRHDLWCFLKCWAFGTLRVKMKYLLSCAADIFRLGSWSGCLRRSTNDLRTTWGETTWSHWWPVNTLGTGWE